MRPFLAVALVLTFCAPAFAATKKAPPPAKATTKTPEPAPAAEAAPAPAPEAKPAEPVRAVETVPAAALPEVKTDTPKPSAAPMRVAVLDPQKTGDIPERALAAFTLSLVPELRKLQGISAVGMGEVRDMLAFEKQRQLLGCGDESCLADIGGALGVDEIVTIQVALTGGKYSLSMRRMNMRKAKMVSAEHKVFDKRDGEELLAIVGPMVEALYPDRQLKEGKVRGVEEAVIKRLNPPPLPKWVFVATTAAAVAAAGVGGVFSVFQDQSQGHYNDLATLSQTQAVSGKELLQRQAETTANYEVARALYCVGGGLAAVAIIEAVFTDWHDDRVNFAVGPTGVGVSGTF